MRISMKALEVLRDILEGRGTHHRCYGQSQHGGRSRILYSLILKRLIDIDYKITEAGRKLLGEKP